MNIKNRIKKLESATSNEGNCACKSVHKFETYLQDLSEGDQNTAPHLSSEPVPEICNQCGKNIEKHIIKIQLVDETTKERFPEEWNAYNTSK